MNSASHWEHIYGKRPPEEQGWYAQTLQPSLDWIVQSATSTEARILDAGGGASTLIDHLLAAGFSRLTVLDISGAALHETRNRLGGAAAGVRWIKGDILTEDLAPNSMDVWHDRAVFHFLHDESERATYKSQVLATLSPDGFLIMGSFRPGAPQKCSGLPVRHHSAAELAAFFAPEMVLEEQMHTTHVTPGGVEQDYVFVRLRRQRTGNDT